MKDDCGKYFGDRRDITRKLDRHYEKIIKRLHEHKYLGKIMSADYSNIGVRLFDVNKFAMDVGVSSMDLKILLPIKTSDQVGWNLPEEPGVEEFEEAIPRIEYYRQIKKQIFDARKKGDYKKIQELDTKLRHYVYVSTSKNSTFEKTI